MYRYKQLNLNKEDIISDLNMAVKETSKDLLGSFGGFRTYVLVR